MLASSLAPTSCTTLVNSNAAQKFFSSPDWYQTYLTAVFYTDEQLDNFFVEEKCKHSYTALWKIPAESNSVFPQ